MQFLLLLLKKDNQEDTNNEVQSHLQLLGRQMLTKVRIYRGAEHKHEAQKPEVLVLK